MSVSLSTETVLVLSRLKKPRYIQNRATNYDLRRNRLLGINVSRSTETVPENVLSGSQNPQVHSNSRGHYLLGFSVSPYTKIVLENVFSGPKKPPGTVKIVRKLSSVHQRIAVHRNNPQKRVQWVQKKNRYSQIHATNCDLRRNRLLGISVSPYTEIVLKSVLSASKKPLDTLRFN